MRIVGLTGGIATGKSTVSNQLRGAGLPVVDFDVIARDVCLKIVDMPLLMEVGAHRLLRPSVVVICSHDTEVSRLMKRDGIDHEQAAEKIAAQMPLKKKQKLADIVIDNSGSPAQTKLQVEQLIARLRQGASFWGVVFSPLLLAAAIVSLLAARLLK